MELPKFVLFPIKSTFPVGKAIIGVMFPIKSTFPVGKVCLLKGVIYEWCNTWDENASTTQK